MIEKYIEMQANYFRLLAFKMKYHGTYKVNINDKISRLLVYLLEVQEIYTFRGFCDLHSVMTAYYMGIPLSKYTDI